MAVSTFLAELTSDDFIAGVFAESGVEKIPSSKAFLHDFFSQVSPDGKPEGIAKVLKRMSFSHGDIFPFSREFESTLLRLQIAGLLSAMNPDYHHFLMSPNQIAKARERLQTFEADEQATIKEIAESFSAAVNEITAE